MSGYTRYSLGFALSPDKSKVVLIRKNRPEFMAGKLNGVGGKKEDGETPYETMVREFQEETGVYIAESEWKLFGIMKARNYEVSCFYTTCHHFPVKTMTDERIEEITLDANGLELIRQEGISNLPWMIGMLLDRDISRMFFNMEYDGL